MKNNSTHLRMAFAGLVLCGFASSAAADAHEAPPAPGILDTYACTYNDGKGLDDLLAARDFYLQQYEKAGLTAPEAYLWSLLKGEAPVDVVWFDVHENLAAFGSSLDAAAAATGLEKVQERFDAVVTCETSNVATFVPVYQRESGASGNSVFISSNACNLRHGFGNEHVADLQNHIAGVLEGAEGTTPQAVYMANPVTSGPNSADRYLFLVNDSASAWAEFVAGIGASEAGPPLGRHFNMVFDCNTTMWSAQQVVGGDS